MAWYTIDAESHFRRSGHCWQFQHNSAEFVRVVNSKLLVLLVTRAVRSSHFAARLQSDKSVRNRFLPTKTSNCCLSRQLLCLPLSVSAPFQAFAGASIYLLLIVLHTVTVIDLNCISIKYLVQLNAGWKFLAIYSLESLSIVIVACSAFWKGVTVDCSFVEYSVVK